MLLKMSLLRILKTKSKFVNLPCVFVYLCFGVFLYIYLNKKELSLVVLTDFIDQPANHSAYPDEQLGSLHYLIGKGIFEGKQVGIWRIDTEAHDDAFSLMLAYSYFGPFSETIVEVSDAEDIQLFDYIISPWEESYFENMGTELIHDENWLYVYKKTNKPENNPKK
jgi:hypothetical protein